jgi:hypothetical protein
VSTEIVNRWKAEISESNPHYILMEAGDCMDICAQSTSIEELASIGRDFLIQFASQIIKQPGWIMLSVNLPIIGTVTRRFKTKEELETATLNALACVESVWSLDELRAMHEDNDPKKLLPRLEKEDRRLYRMGDGVTLALCEEQPA